MRQALLYSFSLRIHPFEARFSDGMGHPPAWETWQ
jgi:ribosomal protein L16/L10AE